MKPINRSALCAAVAMLTVACAPAPEESAAAPAPAAAAVPAGIAPELFTDSLFAVMNADRGNYTRLIVARLGPDGANLIKPNEHWEDLPEGAPLPAQMFRFGSEKVAEVTDKFTYQLKSLWPINSQNGARTPMEEEGLNFVVNNPGQNFYGTEELGGISYFTAVYPDVAVSESCTRCHNNHVDTPRTDFALNDVMGGVVIRVPL